jgi:hypothetical protein
LNLARVVVYPSFVRFHPNLLVVVGSLSAHLTTIRGSARDHPAEPFPVSLVYAGTDVGEPAGLRNQIDEEC